MKEEDFLQIIKTIIGDKYIGDDCAYLKDLGIVISQDNLVEDVHFSLKYMTPYDIGYKSAMVNLSDIASSGGIPKYITVGLSLPKHISKEFVKDFYNGLTDALDEVEIIGGDITGAEKIMISVTAIGIDRDRKISSRKNAKTGQVVVTSGPHGSSAGGLKLLQQGEKEKNVLIDAHICLKAQTKFAQKIAENIKEDYAMMDSSDGLADAVFKIAKASKKTLVLDFNKIIFDKELKEQFPKNYKDMILYGGEDYQIISTIPKELADYLNLNIIGKVEDYDNTDVKIINYGERDLNISDLENCYNHFE